VFGKQVLHIGCIDYESSDYWASKVERRGWFYSKIEKVAEELVGIDNAAEGV